MKFRSNAPINDPSAITVPTSNAGYGFSLFILIALVWLVYTRIPREYPVSRSMLQIFRKISQEGKRYLAGWVPREGKQW